MSDETGTEAQEASVERNASTAPAEGAGTPTEPGKTTARSGDGAAKRAGGAAKRRRRRGSRGGRNRRKPKTAAAPDGAATEGPSAAAEDYTDAPADRGLTTEDVAADAREEAGLAEAEPGAVTPADTEASGRAPAKPRIGDTRPAPPAAGGDGAKTRTRRRRRGGRGRGRGRGSGAATETTDAVRADLGVDEAIPSEELDDTALQRRRGRTRKGRPAGRYMMCVHVREDKHTHIAVLEGRSLVEHYVGSLEPDDTAIDGNIYLGKVQNVLPGMEAAFVDIDTPKNGVLYRGDVAFDPGDVEESHPRIERLLKNGQSALVQVTKNPIGAKGARLTQEVSLAGRFVVMVPGEPETYGISKRLPDDERRRLRRLLEGLRPADAGLIVRTAAEGATEVELGRDVERLRAQWEQISKLASRAKAPALVYQEPPLVVRVIREEFTKEYRGVIIDDRELYEQVRSYVEAIAPELADRVEYYDPEEEGLPLYERFHVQEQLLKALDRKVWLPSGGSLIIEGTEALTVIDVNTGKNVGRSNLEETVFRNNLEAAEEVARQLRLRDIGGIIVVDFIDMEIAKNRDEVMRAFRAALARDKTRTQVFEISELGLVEMTRKRISEGLVETFSETCPTCQGRGFLVDESLLQ
jgi:ribonuclease E